MSEVRGLLRASVKASFLGSRAGGLASTLAFMATVAACGSTEPLTGKAPESSENVDNLTADGSVSDGKPDAGRATGTTTPSTDAGKSTSTPAKDAAPEDMNCGHSGFTTGAVIPDMLIVLDRSGSMKPGGGRKGLRCDNIGVFDLATQLECDQQGIDCNNATDKMTTFCGGTVAAGPVDRWTPSVAAVTQLTTQFDATVSFGLMTFPAASNECGPGDLKVPIGLGTGAEIGMVLKNTTPGGGTPTGETLQAALKLFQDSANGDADSVAPLRYVLLVTDGQPTCPNGNGGGGGRGNNAQQADKQFTTDALDALRNAGIKTFVVGYDAALDATFGAALTEFAMHGGTDHYYPVQDENSLTQAFKSISETVITCAFEFKQDVKDKRLVHVTLDKETLVPDTADGWSIEGNTITVQGASCQKLQGGKGHSVEIVRECEPVIYL
jgi:hypothetical protein